MPNSLATAQTFTPSAFPQAGGVGSIFGALTESIVNGIPTAIDGLIEREFPNSPSFNTAGFTPIGDNRTERVAPVDTAPRSNIPFVDFTNDNLKLAIGAGVAVLVVVALVTR